MGQKGPTSRVGSPCEDPAAGAPQLTHPSCRWKVLYHPPSLPRLSVVFLNNTHCCSEESWIPSITTGSGAMCQGVPQSPQSQAYLQPPLGTIWEGTCLILLYLL